ncbi:DoxX family protein [Aureitalea marina]|uniref:DoxX family protein n=1 Tax=Aureitalea marina TaxID=930804 RepID=A0A2S7KN73_9FLAO|nr:DoxX family protein [Aureitalea marina]PQB04075.1 DoxX family protein [Aureitalea marina]
MNRNKDLGMLILRIGVSALMLTHGIPKLLKLFNGDFDFPDPIGWGSTISLIAAVVGEAIAPMLIIIGYKTRLAAALAAITMAVAAFIVHAGDPVGTKEKALFYLVAFVAIGIMGAGKYSLDRR